MIKGSLGLVSALLFAVLAASWLPACGSSEPEESPQAKAHMGAKEGGGSAPAPLSAEQEKRKQEILESLTWTADSPPRDKEADFEECRAQVEANPDLVQDSHSLQGVAAWFRCMRDLGWTRVRP